MVFGKYHPSYSRLTSRAAVAQASVMQSGRPSIVEEWKFELRIELFWIKLQLCLWDRA